MIKSFLKPYLALAAEGIVVVPFCDVRVLTEHQSLSNSASNEQFWAAATVTAAARATVNSVHHDCGVAATRRRFMSSRRGVTDVTRTGFISQHREATTTRNDFSRFTPFNFSSFCFLIVFFFLQLHTSLRILRKFFCCRKKRHRRRRRKSSGSVATLTSTKSCPRRAPKRSRSAPRCARATRRKLTTKERESVCVRVGELVRERTRERERELVRGWGQEREREMLVNDIAGESALRYVIVSRGRVALRCWESMREGEREWEREWKREI